MHASTATTVRLLGAALLLSSAGTADGKKPKRAAAPAPVATPAAPDSTLHPNVFELRSGTLSVSYTRRGADGLPHVDYADGSGEQHFAGAEVRTAGSELGDLVSVTIRRTIDSGSTALTLVVPVVNLESPGESLPVNVLSVTTVHRFSPVPRFNRGQMQTGMPAMLNGTAHN
jgi:hypothetical protein